MLLAPTDSSLIHAGPTLAVGVITVKGTSCHHAQRNVRWRLQCRSDWSLSEEFCLSSHSSTRRFLLCVVVGQTLCSQRSTKPSGYSPGRLCLSYVPPLTFVGESQDNTAVADGDARPVADGVDGVGRRARATLLHTPSQFTPYGLGHRGPSYRAEQYINRSKKLTRTCPLFFNAVTAGIERKSKGRPWLNLQQLRRQKQLLLHQKSRPSMASSSPTRRPWTRSRSSAKSPTPGPSFPRPAMPLGARSPPT